jgi:hypothetical protein
MAMVEHWEPSALERVMHGGANPAQGDLTNVRSLDLLEGRPRYRQKLRLKYRNFVSLLSGFGAVAE